jgi:hypothetical protein
MHKEELDMLNKHEEIIQHDILPRLEKVEKAQMNFNRQVEEIKNSQKNLELTVMKDGQETRGILNKFVDHYFETDREKLAAKRELDRESLLSQRDVIHVDERITLKRLSTKEKIVVGIIGSIAGSGGILAGVAALLQFLK